MNRRIMYGVLYRTRDNHVVRITTTCAKDPIYPVWGLLTEDDGSQRSLGYTKFGQYDKFTKKSDYDLMEVLYD